MSPLPAVRPWLRPLRLSEPNRPRTPRHEPERADDTDNLRREAAERHHEARFAAMDAADRSGPTR